MKKKGFTLIELLVVIAIIAMLLAILMPALNKVKRLAQRLICTTNLKGLGTATMVYSNDFEDQYPVQGGGYAHTWSDRTAGYALLTKDWTTTGNITVAASLFLLVREADVSPKSFVCKSSDQKPFDGTIDSGDDVGQELIELWDFGHPKVSKSNPQSCVSYSYHMPYDRGGGKFFPASSIDPSGMALMADKNPWYDPKLSLTVSFDTWDSAVGNIANDWTSTSEKWEIQVGNAYPHNREGQNVLFNDGHAAFERRTDIAYNKDNIYTNWTIGVGAIPPQGDQEYLRIGWNASTIGSGGPRSKRDSWLVNDDER